MKTKPAKKIELEVGIRQEAFLKILEQHLGVVTPACAEFGISRTTFYDWCRESSDFQTAVDEMQNVALDFVESRLFSRVHEKSDAAIIFYMKTKGRKRGYIERYHIDLNSLSPEQAVAILQADAGADSSEKD